MKGCISWEVSLRVLTAESRKALSNSPLVSASKNLSFLTVSFNWTSYVFLIPEKVLTIISTILLFDLEISYETLRSPVVQQGWSLPYMHSSKELRIYVSIRAMINIPIVRNLDAWLEKCDKACILTNFFSGRKTARMTSCDMTYM